MHPVPTTRKSLIGDVRYAGILHLIANMVVNFCLPIKFHQIEYSLGRAAQLFSSDPFPVSPSQDLGNTDVMNDFEASEEHNMEHKSMKSPEFDIVFIGYGFTSLGIAWALKQKDASLKMAFVSEEKPGGLWWDADNVKLHIPNPNISLCSPGLPYDEPECHTDSFQRARQYAWGKC